MTFELPTRSLGRSDVKFQIKRDGETFGTMTISNGSVVWFPKGVSYGCRMKWKQFNELMQREAKQFKSDDRRVPNHRPNFPLPTLGERD